MLLLYDSIIVRESIVPYVAGLPHIRGVTDDQRKLVLVLVSVLVLGLVTGDSS